MPKYLCVVIDNFFHKNKMRLHPTYRSFLISNISILLVLGMVFTWMSQDGAIDFWLSNYFFDGISHTFFLKDAPLLKSVGHAFLKNVTACFLLIGIVLAILSFPLKRLRLMRGPLIEFCILAGLSVLLISRLKSHSIHSCPWDLSMYGGHAIWLPLFDNLASNIQPGHCWPGGHASGGFALIAGYFSFLDYRPKWARLFLTSGLLLGLLMGFVQVMRGAHFISHNLWTLWFIWALCFGLDAVFRCGRFYRQKLDRRERQTIT